MTSLVESGRSSDQVDTREKPNLLPSAPPSYLKRTRGTIAAFLRTQEAAEPTVVKMLQAEARTCGMSTLSISLAAFSESCQACTTAERVALPIKASQSRSANLDSSSSPCFRIHWMISWATPSSPLLVPARNPSVCKTATSRRI